MPCASPDLKQAGACVKNNAGNLGKRFTRGVIDGLRKAGDAPGHKIVVAVCVCVFVFVFVFVVVVVVVVVVMLGSSLWGRK